MLKIMSKSATEIAEKLRDVLKENFSDFDGLYLYGSHAKGLATNDSDIDIVVLIESFDLDKRSIYHKITSRFRYENDADLDLHPMSRRELEENPVFYNEVVNKGIFYAAKK